MKNLQVESLVLGGMATNCYLVMHKISRKLLIIDPAAEPERIVARIEAMKAEPEAVLLTHGHFDHIGAVDELREKYQIPVCALDREREILEDEYNNLSSMVGRGFTVSADRTFCDGERVTFGGMVCRVINTPGHTAGSACYYFPDEAALFSGDTLFRCSVGRTDFPTGSMSQIHDSIHTKLFVLPEDTIVFPGHNEETDIEYEKQNNPY